MKIQADLYAVKIAPLSLNLKQVFGVLLLRFEFKPHIYKDILNHVN